jgi:hypothetical protein
MLAGTYQVALTDAQQAERADLVRWRCRPLAGCPTAADPSTVLWLLFDSVQSPS